MQHADEYQPQGDRPPIAWLDLVDILESGELWRLFRRDEHAQKYKDFRACLTQKGRDINQHIVEHVLGYVGPFERQCFFLKTIELSEAVYSIYVQAEDRQFKDYPWLQHFSLQPFSGVLSPHSNIIMLTENVFPYALEPTIHHWILWSNHKISDAALDAILKSIPFQHKYIAKVNRPSYQSVKNVFHAHLFIHYGHT